MPIDKRKPKLEKVGCYSSGEIKGFSFFKNIELNDNDVFIYNKGILWRLL